MKANKIALLITPLLLVAACVQLPEKPLERQQTAVLQPETAVTPLLYYTERIADRLFQDLKPIAPGAIAVVSFTDVKSLAP